MKMFNKIERNCTGNACIEPLLSSRKYGHKFSLISPRDW